MERTSALRLGAVGAVTALGLLGGFAYAVGTDDAPAPLSAQLAGSDDVADDISGPCDEAEHAGDPECAGTGAAASADDDGTTTTTVAPAPPTTNAPSTAAAPAGTTRTLDAAGAGTVTYRVAGGTLELVSADAVPGWKVEVEQSIGRELEVDFRSGEQRVQVNVELEDGEVRERVRVRDDDGDDEADDRDGDDGRVDDDDHDGDDNSGPGNAEDDRDDDDDDDRSGHGGGDDDGDSSGHGGGDDDGGGSDDD